MTVSGAGSARMDGNCALSMPNAAKKEGADADPHEGASLK
jgi:hypothetical protein